METSSYYAERDAMPEPATEEAPVYEQIKHLSTEVAGAAANLEERRRSHNASVMALEEAEKRFASAANSLGQLMKRHQSNGGLNLPKSSRLERRDALDVG